MTNAGSPTMRKRRVYGHSTKIAVRNVQYVQEGWSGKLREVWTKTTQC